MAKLESIFDLLINYSEETLEIQPTTLFDSLPDEIIQLILTFLLPDYHTITQQPKWWKKYFHTNDPNLKHEHFDPGNPETLLTLLSFASLNKFRFRIEFNEYFHEMFNACFKINALLSTKASPDSGNMNYQGDWGNLLREANLFGRYYLAKEIGCLTQLEDDDSDGSVNLPWEMVDIGEEEDIDEYMGNQMKLLEIRYEEEEDYLIRYLVEMFGIKREFQPHFTSTVLVETISDSNKLDMSGKSLEVHISSNIDSQFWTEWESKWYDRLKSFIFATITIDKSFPIEPITFPDNIIELNIVTKTNSNPQFIFPNVRKLTVTAYDSNSLHFINRTSFPKLTNLKLTIPIETRLNNREIFNELDSLCVEYNYFEYLNEDVEDFLNLKPKHLLTYQYALDPKKELNQIPRLYNHGEYNNIRVSLSDATLGTFYSMTYE